MHAWVQGLDAVETLLDSCHALVSHGEAVRLHFPRWFRQPGINKVTQNPPPEPPEGAPRG